MDMYSSATRWANNNPEKVKKYKRQAQRKAVKAWVEWLCTNFNVSCAVCGFNDCYAAIDFHHINPDTKEITISEYIRTRSPNKEEYRQIVSKEIKKGVFLCSNCHRKLHANFFSLL
jgi:hypothetical protein